ncbi:MAG: excinuclease ABC subunit UvrC [Thiotrichales bacterium]
MSDNKTLTFDYRERLASMPGAPGVYRMLDGSGAILYVGKAKNLKKRVSSYFVKQQSSLRVARMVAQVCDIEITVTETEAEALLLESNLIKQHRPRYNILLRDDKSYPYIYVSTKAEFPRLSFYRGGRSKPGQFFGPYPSAAAVRFTLGHLQKLFKIRLCEDSYFHNRSRPCLQYQIKRCSAPCVGLISKDAYAADIADSLRFLQGKSDELIHERVARMEAASQALKFEQAAQYRDQIELIRKVSQQQYVSGAKGDVDVIAGVLDKSMACVQVFFIRNGSSLGNRSYFPRLPDRETTIEEVLSAFVTQYYPAHEIPAEIILSDDLNDREALTQMLAAARGTAVRLSFRVRGERAKWVEIARRNALVAMQSRRTSRAHIVARYEDLAERLMLDAIPARMECFDISHTAGEATVASCVVFNDVGPLSSDYRRFNIKDITPGDDYAAMHQALSRRYKRLSEGEGTIPDILLIDGGKGQLREAQEVLDEFQVQGVTLIGVAKGKERKAGLETLFVGDSAKPVILPANSPALALIQHIRDEAHRFAITGHRQRRNKARVTSSLESIPGLGPKRRQSLLKQFGGLQGVQAASVEELSKVPGISRKLAEDIYTSYHQDG